MLNAFILEEDMNLSEAFLLANQKKGGMVGFDEPPPSNGRLDFLPVFFLLGLHMFCRFDGKDIEVANITITAGSIIIYR